MPTYAFDPVRKLVLIPSGTVEVDMREVYTQMHEWLASDDGMPSEVPIRARGHEDISLALYTDVIFVLQNGWKLKPEGGAGSPPWPQGVGHDPGFEFTGWRDPAVWVVNKGALSSDPINVRFNDEFGEADSALRFDSNGEGECEGVWHMPGPMDMSFMSTMCYWFYVEESQLENLHHLGVHFGNDTGFAAELEFEVDHEFVIPGWNHITMAIGDRWWQSFGGGTFANPITSIKFHLVAEAGAEVWGAVDRVAYNHSAYPTATIGVKPLAGVANGFLSAMQSRGIPFYMPFVETLADDGIDQLGNPGFALESELHTALQSRLCIPINAFTGDETTQTREETRYEIKSNANWVARTFEYGFPQVRQAMRFAAIRSLGTHDHVSFELIDRLRDFVDYSMSTANVGHNHLPFEGPYHVRVLNAWKTLMSVQDIKDAIDYTLTSGLYCNLLIHGVEDASSDPDKYTVAEFEEILDYFASAGLDVLDPFTLINKTGTYTLTITGSCFDEAGVDVPITVPPDTGAIEVVRVVATHGTIWEVGDVFQELVGIADKMVEIHEIHGLNRDKPLVVSKTRRTAGAGIDQAITIDEVNDETTVERQ